MVESVSAQHCDREEIERLRSELSDLRERFDLAVDQSAIGTWDWNAVTGETYWSPTFRRIIGAAPDTPADLDLLKRRMHPDDVAPISEITNQAERRFDVQYRILKDNGRTTWIRARGNTMRDSEGRIRRIAGTLEDISGDVTVREFRQKCSELLSDPNGTTDSKVQDVLRLACDCLQLPFGGVVRFDGDWCDMVYRAHPDDHTPMAPRIPANETFSSTVWRENDVCAIHDVDQSAFRDIDLVRRRGLSAYIGAPLVVLGERYGVIWLAGRDTREPFAVWEESILTLLGQAVGRELGRARHIDAVKFNEQRFVLATRAAKMGVAEWSLEDWETPFYSDQVCRLLGYQPGDFERTRDVIASRIHPDDRERVRAAMGLLQDSGEAVDLEYRVRHRTDGYLWFRGTANATRDAEGNTRIIATFQDIDDIKKAQERAEAANVAKSQFLATMSHEIRTPLNGVLGMAAAMANTSLDPKQHRMLSTINDSGHALLSLINEILDLSKMEAGKLELASETFALDEVIESVGALFGPRAREKGLELDIDIAPSARSAFVGDPHRIRQILANLISNAIKFTDSGAVGIAADLLAGEGDGAWVRLDVRDTGVGMSEEDCKSLFTPFTQLDSTDARRHQGTGLGLAIVHRLAGLFGGSIEVTSVPGKGSTFSVRLPLTRADAGPKSADGASAEAPAALAGDDRPLRALSVDDNATNRMVMEAVLDASNAEVVSVASGQDALDVLKSREFDVVLLDIQMPDMNGIEALAAMRAQERRLGQSRTPALAVTANALSHQVDEYLAAGFDGHVAKPVSISNLLGEISRVVQREEADETLAVLEAR